MQRDSFYYQNNGILWNVLNSLPKNIKKILGNVDFLINFDPIKVGLHNFLDAGDGRFYNTTSHACYEVHQNHLSKDKRNATVVLLDGDYNDRNVILHELGHILDERLDFQAPPFYPLDEYAGTDHWEAFATAFQAYLTTPEQTDKSYIKTNKNDLLEIDIDAYYFFENLGKY